MRMNAKGHAHAVKMTTGSLWKNILFFSLPLMLSQLLEVLFNLSDVAVAGKFADYKALGAVGSTTLLVSLFTGFLIGMGSGVNVCVAHRLGAGSEKGAAVTIHSSFVICTVTGLVLGAAGIAFAQPLLSLLHTKDELIGGAVLYLKIYSLGMPAMAIYNFGNGVLSACGETKRPLLYLTVAGVLNVILNLFFVIVCRMAADGVAIASVISQYLSAVLIVRHLLCRRDACRLHLSRGYLDRRACENVLSLGIMTQPELAKLQNPSMAAVLEHVVGHWGAVLISVGLIISLLGALLSWVLLCAEIMFSAAKDHTMPAFLKKENANHVPVNALWLTNAMVQVFLVITLFSASTYLSLIYLATSMILVPYLWSAAYGLLLAVRGETYENALAERKKDLIIGGIALIYAVWLLYAGGLKYLLLSALLYAPGAIFFAKAKRETGQQVFTSIEKVIFAAVVIGALVAAYGLYDGFLTL